jgi:hypothetical protein
MKKSDLKVIVGGMKLSRAYLNRQFDHAFVTDSRLLGVLVLYIRWRSGRGAHRLGDVSDFHQFFYIDASAVGIESYRSLRGNDPAPLREIEQAMLGGLGSGKVDLAEREAFMLLQEYAALNEKLGIDLPEGREAYDFILEEPIDATEAERAALFEKICVKPDHLNQLINYFLMRYFAADAKGMAFLSEPGTSRDVPLCEGESTMCMNRIEAHSDASGAVSYICESLAESDAGYRIVLSELRVEQERISDFKLISELLISETEAAMKLERPEYITVYDIMSDIGGAYQYLDERFIGAMKHDTDDGRLYLNFREDNNYLKKKVYRLNDDVKDMLYISNEGQMVLAAYSLSAIRRLEKEAADFPFGRKLMPIAQYEFKEDVFYDFVRNDGTDFVDFVEYICDFGPDNED